MTRSHRSSFSRSLSLCGLYVLAFVVTTVTSAMLTGCGSADESESGPLPLETWSTSGQKPTSATNSSGASSTTSTSTTASTSGATTGTGTTSTAPTEATDAGSTTTRTAPVDAATTCVATTDEGNAAGVGKYCTSDSACSSGLLCSADFNAPAGDTFCSKICTTDADCGGSGATCFAAMGTHACVTAACAPVAATLF